MHTPEAKTTTSELLYSQPLVSGRRSNSFPFIFLPTLSALLRKSLLNFYLKNFLFYKLPEVLFIMGFRFL
jgi:hypothetical protein